jgi:hypothetical protein
MFSQVKAKIRAWLIDLVREAIRIEQFGRDQMSKSPDMTIPTRWDTRIPIPSFSAQPGNFANSKPFPGISQETWEATNLSFEQMQATAIAAQEKYYEPRKD